MYFQTGQHSVERDYKDGIANGMEKEYYEDGSLQQKGKFKDRKEEGVWEMYFPNGQVKQRSSFKNGVIDGETTLYYSTGRVLAVENTKNGKTLPDKRLEKIDATMAKGHESYKEEDFKALTPRLILPEAPLNWMILILLTPLLILTWHCIMNHIWPQR